MNLRKYYILLVLPFFLNSCSSVVFPDIVDEDKVVSQQARTEQQRTIERGSSLPSDEANAAFEGDEKRNVPVYKGLPQKTETNDEELNEALETGDPEVEKADGVAALYVPGGDNVIITEARYSEPEEPRRPGPADPDFAPSMTYRVATLYFDTGQSAVPSEYRQTLRNIAKQAKEKNARVYVYGFASSRTRNMDIASHKLALFNISLKRAQSVAAELRRAGVSSDVIFVEALSDTVPAYLEVMPEGERLNRRAEVFIAY
jgi:outer membrane protein OmpA-like peptidoglycan-associated protein